MEKESLVLTAGWNIHSTLKTPGVSILTVPITSSYTVSFFLLTLFVCISIGKRDIRALPVKCDNVERGCEWEGTVGTLDKHVAACKFTPVPCPNQCKEKDEIVHVIRKYLDIHINNECLNRDHKCPYCGEKGTYANIMQIHDSVCEKKEIPCTNTECTETIERGKMKHHLDDCDYTIIACKYKKIGCDVKLKRKDMPAHEEDDSIHLHQALGTVVKLQDNLQSANDTIAALQDKVQGNMKSANDTIRALWGEVATLHRDRESVNNIISALQSKVVTLQGDMKSTQDTLQSVTRTGKPLIFKLAEYQKKKDNNERTGSPSFYTSPEGYHMCLQIYANGYVDAKQTHVSTLVEILEGEHDNTLKWPFIGTYCIELLNQLEDKNHYTKTANIKGKDKANVGSWWGYSTFIPHSELSHDPSKNTQYLKDDTLYFRLTVTPSAWLDLHHY